MLDRILQIVRAGDHARALALYAKHLPTLLDVSPLTCLTHRDIGHAYRMVGECHRALGDYPQAEAALLSALHHCEESLALLSPAFPPDSQLQALLDVQQIHHLLGDTYVALSEAADDHSGACHLALEALELACKAEDEATALLSDDLDAERDKEVKEALLSAHINVAVVYQRLMALAALPPPSPPLAEPLDSPAHYLRLSQKRLKKAYTAAKSFSLHLYQFLCQWHLLQGEVKGGEKAAALVHAKEGLEVFQRCRAEGKSRQLEWEEAEWKREEVDLLIEGAKVVRDMLEGGEVEDGPQAAEEMRAEAFGWVDGLRRRMKAGEIEVEEEKRREVVRLFNALKLSRGGGDGSKAAPLQAKDANVGDIRVETSIKRRKVLEG